MPRSITINDFLTKDQIHRAMMIWRTSEFPAKKIAEIVIAPNMAAINAKLGMDNSPLFLAYSCEHVFDRLLKEERK